MSFKLDELVTCAGRTYRVAEDDGGQFIRAIRVGRGFSARNATTLLVRAATRSAEENLAKSENKGQ